MTIEQIAKKLDDCANERHCSKCDFELIKSDQNTCRTMMIRLMASECELIAKKIEDDGK